MALSIISLKQTDELGRWKNIVLQIHCCVYGFVISQVLVKEHTRNEQMGKAALSPLGEVGPTARFHCDSFCGTAFLFLCAAAFPESRAVMPDFPALQLMPLSEQRGDLLTQRVGKHRQNILSRMHCATQCSSIPAGKSSSTARHSLTGSSRVCLVIINWCFQLLQLCMWKRRFDLVWACTYRCMQGHTGCSYTHCWMKGMALLPLHLLCTCVCVCERDFPAPWHVSVSMCLYTKVKILCVGAVFKWVQLH